MAAAPVAWCGPPVAQVRPAADNYFGTVLIDSYRWMERSDDTEFREFLQAQSAYARSTLARIPGRDRIARDIDAIDGLAARISNMTPDGDLLFYLKHVPGEDSAKLLMRKTRGGHERVLVDPQSLEREWHNAEITNIAPSMDGTTLAYTLTGSKPEDTVLQVMNIATGHLLPDRIARPQHTAIAWAPDGNSFFYTAPQKPADDAPASGQSMSAPPTPLCIYVHKLGTDQDRDETVLDSARLPFPFIAKQIVPQLVVPSGSYYVLATVSDMVSQEVSIYAARYSELGLQPVPWREVAKPSDGVTALAVSGSIAFLMTHKDAPHFRVVSEDLADAGFAGARTVVPEGAGILTGITAAADALYIADRRGADMHLSRLDYLASRPQEIPLPFAGTITASVAGPGVPAPTGGRGGLVADTRAPGALIALESWVQPQTWLHYDPHIEEVEELDIAAAFPRKLSEYETTELSVTADDGTHIPLSVVHRRDARPDHARPTLLDGYGSYGYAYDPRFLPWVLPWLDRGGVYAVAHVRGGGEFGELWHAGGRGPTKQNTVTDFIACARALIAHGYTSAAHLAASGTNAGGITAGDAILREPALFRAAVIHDGATDILRDRSHDAGDLRMREFGSPHDRSQFADLLGMDAYQHVKDGIEYPAVLLTGNVNEADTPLWEPAKMAARLQAATTSGHPVLLRVELDSATSPSTIRAQHNAEQADTFAFLLWQLQ